MTVRPPMRNIISRGRRRLWRCLVAGLLGLPVPLAGQPAAPAATSAEILMILPYGRLRPANAEFERGLREGLDTTGGRGVTVHAEYLDAPAFAGDAHEASFARYIAGKYGERTLDVVVAAGVEGLGFVLHRDLGPLARLPVVYSFVERGLLQTLEPLPPRFVGQSYEQDISGTIELALRLQPKTRHLWVVTGDRSMIDRRYGALTRTQAAQFEGRVAVEYLTGLATDELLARLRQAGPDTVVVTLGYDVDGKGVVASHRESIKAMVAASTAPIYSQAFLGSGVVGGYAVDFELLGRAAGTAARRLVDGATPESLRSESYLDEPHTLMIDWRQLQRWRIDPGLIPDGAAILYRKPSFLEENRGIVIGASSVVLLQAGLIAWLLFERRRRRHAELVAHRQRLELAHASRVAMTAELTGAIAHEINQPLGAILSNADAADLSLRNNRASPELLREIMADIHRDVLRASDVVKSLRTFFSRREVPKERLDLNVLLADIDAFMQIEARRRRMRIELFRGTDALPVFGNRIELQQVVVNLILNAMDAMDATPEDRRRVSVSAAAAGDTAVIEVRDLGRGIAPDQLTRLFESFYTTKPNGMGLGLSISRTLVEAHEGRISAENAPEGGALFRVELPLDRHGAARREDHA